MEDNMKTKKIFFSEAYQTKTQKDINSLYSSWASSYDDELKQMGYFSPKRCALALKRFVSLQTPILDFGCGTGLSGVALKKAGFSKIFASEINNNMRSIAQEKNIYETFYETNYKNPFPKNKKFYAINAVGVISSGAGPPSLLKTSMNYLKTDGFICFSYNDHTLSVKSYMDVILELKDSGQVKEVFCEHGDHLKSKLIGSTVYILQKII